MSYDTNAAEYLYTGVVDISSAGDNTIIAAPTTSGNYIAIDFLAFLPTSAVEVTFKSGTTDLSGALPLDAKQTITFENTFQNSRGVITCAPNEAFIMNLGGAIQVGGMVRYRVVGN